MLLRSPLSVPGGLPIGATDRRWWADAPRLRRKLKRKWLSIGDIDRQRNNGHSYCGEDTAHVNDSN
jgi:hypothetical protein